MADALDTKLIYKRGTCFSCRKCLYCAVYLQTQKFKCDITKPLIEAIELKLSNMRIHEFLRPIGQKIKFLLLEKNILHYNY